MSGEIIIERPEGIDSSSTHLVCEMGTIVECNLRGYLLKRNSVNALEGEVVVSLAEAVRGDAFEDIERARFQIGEGDCIPGLELALKYAIPLLTYRMRCSPKFAFGSDGRCTADGENAVPPDCDIEYEILVTSFSDDSEVEEGNHDGGDLSADEVEQKCFKFNDLAVLRKECGNRWFSYKDYSRAARSYSKGVQITDSFLGSLAQVNNSTLHFSNLKDDSSYRALENSRLALLTNLSLCYLQMDQFGKARDVCITVLEIEPTNKKALLRAARASLALCDYIECKACLHRILELDPSNLTAQQELRRCQQAIKASKVKEQAFARGAFSTSSAAVNSVSSVDTNSMIDYIDGTAAPTSTSTSTSTSISNAQNCDTKEKVGKSGSSLTRTLLVAGGLISILLSLWLYYSGLRPKTSST